MVTLSRQGFALLFTLTVGSLLLILASSLLVLYGSDSYSQKQQQLSLQAYWNARAGVERYSLTRTLPIEGFYSLGRVGSCQVTSEAGNLCFQGISGSQSRRIVLISGDPSHRREEP